MALQLVITGAVPQGVDLEPAKRVFAELLKSEVKLPDGSVNLALVNDAESQRLNNSYSGHDYATDVLSFSYIERGGKAIGGVVGDIAVSFETAQRQADKAGTSLAEEVALLLLHGVLHVAGLDHQTPEQQAQVQKLQYQLLTAADCRYREFAWEN
jgi:probable rRNA maturation factor